MNLYERYCLPHLLDVACGVKPVRMQRDKIVPQATGDVLEIGIGTGLNLPHYDVGHVHQLQGLDPASGIQRKARKRMDRAGLDAVMIPLTAEAIPREDNSFDSIVMTYALCSIPDPLAALAEMRRVLKPSGKLLFSEHGLAPDAKVARWQMRLTPAWRKIAGNCHMDRDIPALLREGGFALPDVQSMYIPGPKILSYHVWGAALPVA